MDSLITLDRALCFPAADVQALADGRVVGLISGVSLSQGARFALYPGSLTFLDFEPEHCYQSKFQRVVRMAFAHRELDQESDHGTPPVELQYWAECQGCRIVNSAEELEAIAAIGVWQQEFLQTWLTHRQYIILAFLRVYQLPEPRVETTPAKVGKFVGLSQPIRVQTRLPVLDEIIFRQRLEQAQALAPPLYPELEDLEATLANSLYATHPATQTLLADLKSILGWRPVSHRQTDRTDIAWMNQIAALGERSKELDRGKSNYQAGTDFEIAVRRSLEFLGFKIDYAHRGGAGGLDLSCSDPYLLIGECKSGKKIPNDTAVQLLNLGTIRLKNKEAFNQATKLIIGPGHPTEQLEKAALVHGMTILNPYTLEKLVQLQHQYPGSIDLIELKQYLKDGRADDDVSNYIEQVREDIHLRALITNQVREYLLNAKAKAANLDSLHAVYTVSNPPKRLTREEFHNILIELASPLAGYLGRTSTSNGHDCFYFLRSVSAAAAAF